MMANNPVLDVVYVPQWFSDNIGMYKIQPDGSLIDLPGAPVITGNSPRYIAVDAKGTYAYIAFGLENVIKKYRFSPEGSLIYETSYAVGSTPRTIQIHNNGKFLYVANYGGTLIIFNVLLFLLFMKAT